MYSTTQFPLCIAKNNRKKIAPRICLKPFLLLFSFCCTLQLLPAQDTIYLNRYYEPTTDTSLMETYEIHTRKPNGEVVVASMTKDHQYIAVLQYADYQKAILNGKSKYWYYNGGVQVVIPYVNGQKQGTETVYHENGKVYRQIKWDADTIVSAAFFNEDGSPKTDIYKEDIEQAFNTMKFPQFPGGEVALQQFLRENINYPIYARENNLMGMVVCKMVVGKNGMIEDVEAVVNPHPSLSKEAIRVIKAMPRWDPGIVEQRPVRVRFTLPINFRLE